ncbi:MAG: type 4a pilus biogenesis protein PilO, partial [Terriglobales bacterium]
MPQFNDMPPRSQFTLLLVLAIVVFLAGEYAWLSPMRATNTQTAQQLAEIQAQNNSLKPYARRTELLRAENRTLERQLQTLLSIVPSHEATDQFLRSIQAAASESEVHIRSITAKPVLRKQFYTAAPYQVSLDGAYGGLQAFYQRLAGLRRIVNVNGITMQRLANTDHGEFPYTPGESVTAHCTLTTFYSQPDGAEAARPGAGRVR